MRPSDMVHRHLRLIVAALAGLGVGLAAVGLDIPLRVLIGADLFFAIYLALIFDWLRGRAGRDLRAHFEDGDEGAVWISALAVGIVVISLYASIATMIGASPGSASGAAAGAASGAGTAQGGVGPMGAILALAAVPLGWITLHTVMALHYAAIFYRAEDRLARGEGVEQNSAHPFPADPAAVAPPRDAAQTTPSGTPATPPATPAPAPRDRGGLDFSGDWPEPGPWEFLYYSFTMGMAAQTSDTAVTSTEMRRVTLIHAILSYFYNAVIVALAVNAGMSLGQ